MRGIKKEPVLGCINDDIPLSEIIAISSSMVDEYTEHVDVYVDFRGNGKLIEDPIENDQAFAANLEQVKKDLLEKGMLLELLIAPNGKELWVNKNFVPTVKQQFKSSQELEDACSDKNLPVFVIM